MDAGAGSILPMSSLLTPLLQGNFDSADFVSILAYIFLIFCGAYFACAESAYARANKIRLKNYADDGDRRAKNAVYIENNFDRALTTVLVGTNIVHLTCSSLATVVAVKLLGSGYTAAATVVTTVIVFLFAEMIPKSYANAKSEKVALAFSGSLRMLMKLLSPVVFLFVGISKLFSKLFTPKVQPTITEDELGKIIDTVEEEGVLDEEQSDLLQSAMDFSGKVASDVMTMREDIVAIDINMPADEIFQIVKESKYSRIPVYSGDLDRLLGVLRLRAYLRSYTKTGSANIRKLLDTPFYISPNGAVSDLIPEMSQRKKYIAFVRDESGHILGLATVEDFIEELVGEIWDEDDVVDDNFMKLGGNRFEVSGTLDIKDAFARMGFEDDNKTLEYKSIQSWVLEEFGRVPEEDDEFEYKNLTVTVDSVEENRVRKVIIKINDEQATAASADREEAEV